MTSRLKIIVGVDYGTTYTGVSYVTTNNTRDKIAVIQNWPHVPGQSKTPTVISYKSENPQDRRGPDVRWGADVKDAMTSCSWTKLLLDTSAETREYDDPSLENAAGSVLFHLPAGKSAQQVCQDFLTQVYCHVMQALEAHYPAHLSITPIEFYFTMPAIWTDRAQAATKDAARGAGFGKRSLDAIHMITEPEAAAIAALKEELSPGSLNAAKIGDNFLVLDCGGGTVDITTYSIKRTHPIIDFGEICEGSGGKCGSTYIDREFRKLLVRRFGMAFEDEPEVFKSPKSRLMQEFEKAKRIFGSTDQDCFEISGINLRGEFSEEHYDSTEGAVLLSKQDMEDIFAPVLKDIIRLLSDQFEKALRKGKRIGLVILVGGFGSSDYLKQAVDRWCIEKTGVKCIRPAHCQAAIVRGAAIRGLEGTMPDNLICRRHYGFMWGLPFDSRTDDERYSYMFFGNKYCAGHMNWMIGKGTEVTKSTSATADLRREWAPGQSCVFNDTLYSCSLDSAPKRVEHPRVDIIGSISMDFTGVDMSRFRSRNTREGIHYLLQYQFNMDLRTDEGVLKFHCVSSGKTIGSTTINFTD